MSVWVGSGRQQSGDTRPPVTTASLISNNTSMESGIEAGVLPTVTGSLASARDSLGSLSRAAEPIYDTDHTDLGSELDEAEIRRELMHDKWRLLFDRFDPEGFGEIPWPDFIQTLQHPDFMAQVSHHKREILLDKAQNSTSNAITFQEFVNLTSLEVMANSMKQMESLFTKQMEDFSKRIEQSSTPNKATTASLATELATFRTFIMGALKILQDQFQALSREVDSLEMRSRRKMLLLHGVPEVKGEKTNDINVQTVSQKLKVAGFTNTAISRCHRMGRPNSGDHPRPILLKLREAEVKNEIWFAKTELKGTGITLSEFLTRARHETFMAARQRFGVAKCWTQEGNIVILGSDGTRHRISHHQDLDRLINQLEVPKSASVAEKEPAAAAPVSQKSRRAAATGKK